MKPPDSPYVPPSETPGTYLWPGGDPAGPWCYAGHPPDPPAPDPSPPQPYPAPTPLYASPQPYTAPQPYAPQPYAPQPYVWRPYVRQAGTPAGFWERFGSAFLDLIVLVVLASLADAVGPPTYAVGMLLYPVYFILLVGLGGRTIGNRLVHTRVVAAKTGGPPGLHRAALRWLAQFGLILTGVGWLLDVLWPLWDPRRQSLHDRVARVLLVRT